MIVKLFKSGRSFKALGAYLLHDAGKAATDERLAWTHTLNLAQDHPALAIDEMLGPRALLRILNAPRASRPEADRSNIR